ncbi:MAG: PKD domain-containing protein [Paludibacteraceae bacterium]|nr:PKD domain-containing protein [Paludibacteraceae bacterium]
MKKIYILLTLCCALIACKKIDVEFNYSPTDPRAGQTVTFNNISNGGEDWAWTFGDGGTSVTKSPSYIYKNPGTYIVTLKVDDKNSLTCTKEITVYDTIPTFVASDSAFTIFKDYTFTANVYNPYGYTISYEWKLPANTPYAVVTDSVMNKSTLKLYFTQAMTEAPIWLNLVMNGDTTHIEKTFSVADRETNSVLFRNSEGDYRQRIFGQRAEQVKKDATASTFLDEEQDTFQIYNGKEFRLSELLVDFPFLRGFKIANRKIYYRSESGLWVSSLDGSNRVQIETEDCPAMTLDLLDNRIYWAVSGEVRYMPLIGSDNNQFVTEIKVINTLSNVTKIAVDN